MNQRGNAPLIAVITVSILALGIGLGVRYSQYLEQQKIKQLILKNTEDWKIFNSSDDTSIKPFISFKYPQNLTDFYIIFSRQRNKPEFISEDWMGIIDSKGFFQLEFFRKEDISLKQFIAEGSGLSQDKTFSTIDGYKIVRLGCPKYDQPNQSKNYCWGIYHYAVQLDKNNLLFISAQLSPEKFELEDFGFPDDKDGFSVIDKIIGTIQFTPRSALPSQVKEEVLSIPVAKETPPVSPAVTYPKITITSPNGGEVWKLDNSYTITWQTDQAIKPEDTFWIELRQDGVFEYQVLASNLSNTQRSFSYKPSKIATNNNFRVRVMLVDPGTKNVLSEDGSDKTFSLIRVAAGAEFTSGASSVDVKANGSDGPIKLIIPDNLVLSWTSKNVVRCENTTSWGTSFPSLRSDGSKFYPQVTAGSVTITGDRWWSVFGWNFGGYLGLQSPHAVASDKGNFVIKCWDQNNKEVQDSVGVTIALPNLDPPEIKSITGPTQVKVGEEKSWTFIVDFRKGRIDYNRFQTLWDDEVSSTDSWSTAIVPGAPYYDVNTGSLVLKHTYRKPGQYTIQFYAVNAERSEALGQIVELPSVKTYTVFVN